tara:strand:+ start:1541 stop:3133 length:1593 start_codon:yes stop_codon:yes gene_type:complete
MEKKNNEITNEALLEIQAIKDALNENTKEILRQVAREEIESVVKKSLNEDFDEEDVEDEVSDEAPMDLPVDAEGGLGDDDDSVSLDVSADSEGGEPESFGGLDDMSSDIGGELDLTSASDDEVISVYKELSTEDEIEVVGDEIHLNISQPGKYIIKPNAGGAGMGAPMGEPEMGGLDGGLEGDEMELPMGEPEMGGLEDDEMGEPEMGGLDGDEGGEDEELEFEEGIQYEITGLNENEGAHAEHVKETTPPNTGDIDSQTSKELPSDLTGDNLVGGFGGQEAKNGSGDAHAKHIMGAAGKTDPTAKTNATAKPAEEKIEGGKGGSNGNHGAHVMEGEDDFDAEEITEEEEMLDESIPKGQSDSRRVPGQAEIGAPRGAGAVPIASAGKVPTAESTVSYANLLKEHKALKEENELFKNNLREFRKMIATTGVYSTNLTNAVRIFMEHATTKNEKAAIIKRFDNEVKSITESKELYKKIVSELDSRTTLTEGVNSLDKTSGTGSRQLNEQSAFVDKETARTLELINYRADRK